MRYTQHQLLAYASLFIGRRSDYAIQQEDGRYRRAGQTFTYEALQQHLDGTQTLGSYVMDEKGMCRYAVFDADTEHGLQELAALARQLYTEQGIMTYLEQSRRGGHLWVFLTSPTPASVVRRWLLPSCPSHMEFYPKQEWSSAMVLGSLIRLPLGVHRRSGQAYPFVQSSGKQFQPVAGSVAETLRWLEGVGRVAVPVSPLEDSDDAEHETHTLITKTSGRQTILPSRTVTISEWCAAQDPVGVIGRYVRLNAQGMGCCPFGEHHSDGKDSHPSFRVYDPSFRGGCCWYCYTWGYGGNVFNFLARYHRLDAKTLWSRLLAGEQF